MRDVGAASDVSATEAPTVPDRGISREGLAQLAASRDRRRQVSMPATQQPETPTATQQEVTHAALKRAALIFESDVEDDEDEEEGCPPRLLPMRLRLYRHLLRPRKMVARIGGPRIQYGSSEGESD
jgi:hypothetical protein